MKKRIILAEYFLNSKNIVRIKEHITIENGIIPAVSFSSATLEPEYGFQT